ncbi:MULTISPECIES: rhomboid family intramembrane serine protease [Streptomyces]|uniref:Rhomboid family intramembrane serine protease n=5 Tax=Streptomyces TaxID=1883 RepID=A0A8H9HHU8_9ACTN|nr:MULTISPECIES: rhomboid family intramembrane serine protease [Streptomyces]NEE32411.1 rhomboid family intramembrane serine protease [Streptomyces sp. SID7982]NEE46209.1 rhomboid family intramembrane serine protease [Streptomyces sp. SID8455]MDQ0295963.1 membrane associated rhomboid family serine protease [Streptomyces sp. DSM 41037]PJM85348.1 rhomboid family intramembrane serine protease [Streptomyces sp. TSRI0384-2]QNE80799.1 rhomboid family intramembrane serine protease [Streptomyces rutge
MIVPRFSPLRTAALRLAGRGAPVTYGLIALCAVVFLLGPVSGLVPAYGTGEQVLAAQYAYYDRWGVIPAELFRGRAKEALTPLTALFVHGGWLHLLGNLLFLHVFGTMLEQRMGPVRYLLFYLGCGYLALLGYAAAFAGSAQPLVGASGAISAVLGAFLHLFPGARVTTVLPFLLFLPVRLPAWVVLPFWAALQWAAARGGGEGPGVAYLAHLIGFALGFLYAWSRSGSLRVRTPATATEGDSQP